MDPQTTDSQPDPESGTSSFRTSTSFQHVPTTMSLTNSSFAANLSTNNGSHTSYFTRDEQLAKVEIGVLSIILYLALFGNIFVLVVLRLRRQALTRMQWFIVHLSLTDIFVALFHILPQLLMDITNQFHGDDFLCRSVKYLSVVAMYASSYVMLMAAVDRYVSICHPLTNQILSPKRVHLMILLAWGLSLLFSLPQLFIFSLKEMDGGDNECWADFTPVWGLKAYVTWVFVSVYALPFVPLTFCYVRICLVVWGSVDSKQGGTWANNRLSGSNNRGQRRSDSRSFLWRISFSKPNSNPGNGNCTPSRLDSSDVNGHVAREDAQSLRCLMSTKSKPRGHQRGVSKSKVKTVKLTLAVVLCYLLCWAPFFVVNMLTVWDPSIDFEGPVMTIIALLASLNSCTNPWIYLAFSGRTWPPCGAKSADRSGGGGISRSWTRSTHVTTDSDAPLCNRTSLYELSNRGSTREVGPWTRDHPMRRSIINSNDC